MLLEILFCIIRFMQYTPGQGVRGSTDGEFCWRKAENLLYLKIFLEFTCFFSVYASDFIDVIAVREIQLNWFVKSIFHIVKFEKFWCACLWEFSELTNCVIVRLEIYIHGLLNAECFQRRLRVLQSFVWPFFHFQGCIENFENYDGISLPNCII